MFIPAYREGGGPIEARPYYIATATAIEKGEMVIFTVGVGIAAVGDADQDDPIFGVAARFWLN